MARMKMCTSLEVQTVNKINSIAKSFFRNNNSRALDWIIRHMDWREFARSMAKYHNAEFQRFMSILEDYKGEQTNLDNMISVVKNDSYPK